VLSEYEPSAVNWRVVPLAFDEFAGDTDTAVSTAGVTVSTVVPVIDPRVAVIVVVPAEIPVAVPLAPLALLMFATVMLDDVQITLAVRSCVELSEYMAVAEKCADVPDAIDGFVGVTEIDVSVTWVTVRFAVPDFPFKFADMMEVPDAMPVTVPSGATVATEVLGDVQETCDDMSCVVLSEYTPVAVSLTDVPAPIVGFDGVTTIEASVAGVTVSIVSAEIPLALTLIVVVPVPVEVANPPLVIVATEASEDDHDEDVVMS
jgi:hypothetical protein